MCKTRFGSQGVILDGFYYKKKWKKTLRALATPPLIAKVMINDHFLLASFLLLFQTCKDSTKLSFKTTSSFIAKQSSFEQVASDPGEFNSF